MPPSQREGTAAPAHGGGDAAEVRGGLTCLLVM